MREVKTGRDAGGRLEGKREVKASLEPSCGGS